MQVGPCRHRRTTRWRFAESRRSGNLQVRRHFANYEVVTAASGGEALRVITASAPDLVILDVNLPDVDGFDVCRQLRAAANDVPVIFLTARRTTDDLRAGFAGGGDDYLTKPFSLDELTFRILAVLRPSGLRRASTTSTRLICGHVELDEATHRAWSAREEIQITPTEFRLLRYLLANAEPALTRAQIIDHV